MTAKMSGRDSPAPPPYHFSNGGDKIIIHPKWTGYFSDNADIVRGWTLWHWARFLESRNPSTPSLTAKITGITRSALTKPRKLWDAAILRSPEEMRCIYSNKPLELDNYGVDHYLPWEFVAHDNFWNLTPTLKEINSSKGNTLPDDRYLGKLARMHRIAIATYHERLDLRHGCGELMLSYFTDLHINAHDSPPDDREILEAYRRGVAAYTVIAKNQGFKTGWQYNRDRQSGR